MGQTGIEPCLRMFVAADYSRVVAKAREKGNAMSLAHSQAEVDAITRALAKAKLSN